MATTVSLIIRGLQMLGGKTIDGTLTAAESTSYTAVLNAMLDSWSTERLMVPCLVQESKALTTSDGSYTIGNGGNWNTQRPTKIVDPCFVRDSSSIDRKLGIIDAIAYGSITSKTADGGYPRYLFYDYTFTGGLGNIYLWPEPIAGLTLYINSWKNLRDITSDSVDLELPPGYEEAISSNFAVRASAGYRPLPPETALIARQSKANIMRMNAPPGILRLDAGVASGGRRYDINTGE